QPGAVVLRGPWHTGHGNPPSRDSMLSIVPPGERRRPAGPLWVPDLATKTPGCRPAAVIRVTEPLHSAAFWPSRPASGSVNVMFITFRDQLPGLSSGGSAQERVTGALWPVVKTTEPV